MKKRLLYICSRNCISHNFAFRNSVGIRKKIEAQKRQFRKEGYEVQVAPLDWLPRGKFSRLKEINLFSSSVSWNKVDINKRIDVVYMRFMSSMELGTILLLRSIRRRNKKVKIMFEFQTYPFYPEYCFEERKFAYYKFKFFVKFLKFYVDRIILCTPGYDRLYGIKVLYMPNGVEYKKEKIIAQNTNKNEIHLIAVSSMIDSHGYDRLIKGMGEYYKCRQERKVILHLVGEGVKKDEYMHLAKKYGINDYVLFEGRCTGKKLDDLYLLADIGIDCFGSHRMAENLVSSSLKTREEASYGLPIIGAGKTDLDHASCMKYMLKFPEDDTDINVHKIVAFYDQVYDADKITVRNTIKEVFRPYYDIEETLKEVLDYMKA